MRDSASHLVAVDGVHGRVSVDRDRRQLHVGRLPYALAHRLLYRETMLRFQGIGPRRLQGMDR